MAIPALDFKSMGVLSITRCVSERLETKVIYCYPGKCEGMLYFKCSNEEHGTLALEFKKYLARTSNESL